MDGYSSDILPPVANGTNEMNIEFYGDVNDAAVTNISCSFGDVCKINCFPSGNACSQVQLYCFGNCYILCSNYCPILQHGIINQTVFYLDNNQTQNNNYLTTTSPFSSHKDDYNRFLFIILCVVVIVFVVFCFRQIYVVCSNVTKNSNFISNKRKGKVTKKRKSKKSTELQLETVASIDPSPISSPCEMDINIDFSANAPENIKSENYDLDVIYEDDDIFSKSNDNTTDLRGKDKMFPKMRVQAVIQLWKTFFSNVNCTIGVFALLLNLFLLFVCILYARGQVTDLELANYWCEKKTLDQVYQNSFDNNLNEGTSIGCWKTKQFTVCRVCVVKFYTIPSRDVIFVAIVVRCNLQVDVSALFNTQAYNAEFHFSKWNIVRGMIWVACGVYFFVLACVVVTSPCDLIEMVYKHNITGNDHGSTQTVNQINPTNHNGLSARRRSSFHRCCRYCSCCPTDNKMLECIGDLYWKYIQWYNYHFGPDTHKWLVLLMAREIFEILIQFIAFLNYNGLNVFDLNQVSLSYQQNEIIIFAWILGLNCVFSGILWILYVFWHRLFQGAFYKYLVFIIDTIFDTMYALYPIAVIISQTGATRFGIVAGSLQTNNLYVQFVLYISFFFFG